MVGRRKFLEGLTQYSEFDLFAWAIPGLFPVLLGSDKQAFCSYGQILLFLES